MEPYRAVDIGRSTPDQGGVGGTRESGEAIWPMVSI